MVVVVKLKALLTLWHSWNKNGFNAHTDAQNTLEFASENFLFLPIQQSVGSKQFNSNSVLRPNPTGSTFSSHIHP